jgi:hypothetical protein
MKIYRLFAVALATAGCVGTVNVNQPTVNANAQVDAQVNVAATGAASPDASPLASASPTTAPKASRAPVSFPTRDPAATPPPPEPTPIPTPTPTPVPTPTPTPTPVPVYKLHIHAAVVKGSGDVVPVARTQFVMAPYNIGEIRSGLKPSSEAGRRPQLFDAKYETDCVTVGDNPPICLPDPAKFKPDLAAWEAIPFVGQIDEEKRIAGGRQGFSFMTDLNGEADITFGPGRWFITGDYAILQGTSKVTWLELPVPADGTSSKFELSNDNGIVVNFH